MSVVLTLGFQYISCDRHCREHIAEEPNDAEDHCGDSVEEGGVLTERVTAVVVTSETGIRLLFLGGIIGIIWAACWT